MFLSFAPLFIRCEKERGWGNKKSRPWLGRLCVHSVIYFALTVAILTKNGSLIIRTARTTTIRERLEMKFMGFLFRPIIGGNGNPSRASFSVSEKTNDYILSLLKIIFPP